MKLKRLVEAKQLNESTYGLTQKYEAGQLKRIALGHKLLMRLLDPSDDLKPGFTVYSNDKGSGIQKKFRNQLVTSVIHHLEFWHGPNAPAKAVLNSDVHNVIHSEINDLILDALNEFDYIFDEAYKQYEKKFNYAEQRMSQSKFSEDFYDAIGLRFKAFEDYFRYIHYKLANKTDLDQLAKRIANRVIANNNFNTKLGYGKTEKDLLK